MKTPKILPSIWLLLAVGLMLLAARYIPLMEIPGVAPDLVGTALAGLGLIMLAWSVSGFLKAGTNPVPFQEASALVTSGFYRITRNPMYLGMLLLLLGIALKSGRLGAFLPIPVFAVIIHFRFILPEERFMEDAFGDEYLQYKSRVRRWL